jgi:hypothetical protein
MAPCHFPPNYSNFASPDCSLCLAVRIYSQVRTYPVDVGNAFSEIEFCVFDGVAPFDFDEGDVRRCVAFSASV